MLQHRDDDVEGKELDDGDDCEVSSEEEVYYQTVAVGGRSGRRGVGGGATKPHTMHGCLIIFNII